MTIELSKEQIDALARALLAHVVLSDSAGGPLPEPPWGWGQSMKDVDTLHALHIELCAA